MWNGFCEYSVVVWFVSTTLTTGDLFTTTSTMETLIGFEDILLKEAINYVNQEQLRLTQIRKLIRQVERERGNASKDSRRYLKHPVQSFQLIRRLKRQWNGLKNYISLDKYKNDYLSKMSRVEESPMYPSDTDYAEAAKSLLRLQDTYKLNTTHVADGKITHRQPASPPLLAEDCFEIGVVALNISSPSYVQQWLAEALRRLRDGDAVYEHYIGEIHIMQQLAVAFAKDDLFVEALDYVNKILQKDPDNVSALQKKEDYERKLNILKTGPIPGEKERYKALCRNDEEFIKNEWPRFHRRSLHCHLTHHNRPRLLIRPIKEEIVNEIPKVVLYHDILTETEIRILKKIAEPHLKRAAVVAGTETSATVMSDDRKSNIAWLDVRKLSGLQRIMPRVGDYTGLATKRDDTEYLQVAHYGIGGFYKYHYDDENDGDSSGYEGKGKRIATVLFYLSDVDEGGATVFTRAGVRVAPSKGSAVFWYNYLKNGERDLSSMHAGCPVLMGTKWAANLWIREYSQVFRRKCGLSPDDIY